MKILIIDIETAPTLAYVWRFFKENINPKQVVEYSSILSYSAKWLDSEEIIYNDCREDLDDTGLILEMAALLDEADVVVAHNGKAFDVPRIKAACVLAEVNPPSPFKVVDTCIIARKQFGFPGGNSLENLAKVLDLNHQKLEHAKFPGFKLWAECLKGNGEAWEEMRVYNIHDILVLQDLYLKLRPWMVNHPNAGLYAEKDETVCPKCGSSHIQYRGYAFTNVGKFRRFRCNDCGGWGRHRFSEYPKEKRGALAVNAV